MHRRTALVLGALSSVALIIACSGPHRDRRGESTRAGSGSSEQVGHGAGGRLTIKGSDTMVVLVQHWAERYMQTHPGQTIEVSGGGSGTGIAALLNGTTDLAAASRPLSDRERQRLGPDAQEIPVALDALAVYVHRNNSVRSLTIEQLAEIYRGRVTHWSAVGGPNRPIALYSRENNSGTYAYFKEHVLRGGDFAPATQTLPGTAAVINAVSQDPNGIGYGGIGYASGVREVAIVGENGEPVAPTMDNATGGRYPLARYLFLVTRDTPDGVAREFLEWVRSREGQRLVQEVGFYPLPDLPR